MPAKIVRPSHAVIWWVIVLASVSAVPPGMAQTPKRLSAPARPADKLPGLWKASRRFGPASLGPLVIQRNGDRFAAEMMGLTLAVRSEKGRLAFDLPNGQGAFRGKLDERGDLVGHWFSPDSKALMVGYKFASPVRLKPDGPNGWTGRVLSFEDEFTFYLLVTRRPDGSLAAVLRNPERDFGTWLGVDGVICDGRVVKLTGKRSGQSESRELADGFYDAEHDILTIAFPERGGAYDFSRDDDQSGFYPRGRNPGRYVYCAPQNGDDGWPAGTLEEAGIDRAGIEKFIQRIIEMPMETADAPQVHGVLVARHGRLVVEEYFHGQRRDKLHETRSAAKSVTATIVGAAIQAGVPLELSCPVYRIMNGGAFPPGLDPRKRAMTLEHLLTMSSGYFCDDANPEAPGNEEKMLDQSNEPDYYRYTLKLPMAFAPGEKAVYCF